MLTRKIQTDGIWSTVLYTADEMKKTRSTLHIVYTKTQKQYEIRLKPHDNKENLYAAISSAISIQQPADFDRKKIHSATRGKLKNRDIKVILFLILFITVTVSLGMWLKK